MDILSNQNIHFFMLFKLCSNVLLRVILIINHLLI